MVEEPANWDSMESWDDLPEEWLSHPWLRSRHEQGMPLKVEDPLALEHLATLLVEHDRRAATRALRPAS